MQKQDPTNWGSKLLRRYEETVALLRTSFIWMNGVSIYALQLGILPTSAYFKS